MPDASGEGDERLNEALEKVLSGGILVFAGKVVSLGLGFLIQLIIARLLSTGMYGNVVLTIAVVSIAENFSRLGFNEGMVRKVPEFEDSPSKLRSIITASLSMGTISATAAAVLIFLLAPVLSERFFENPDLVTLLRIGSVAVPLAVIMKISTAIARGARSAKPHAYVNQIVRPIGRFVFIGGLVAAGFEAVGAVAGHVLSYVLALILALWFVYQVFPKNAETTVSMHWNMLMFSLPLTIVHGMNFLMGNVDTFLIGYYLTTSEIGIYNIAFQLRNLLNVIVITIGFLVPPVLAKLETEGHDEELCELYQFVTKWVIFITFPMFVSFLFLPELWLGGLFGNKYLPGTESLFVLGAGVLFSAAVGVTGSSLVGLGRNRIVMYTTGASVAINVLFNILLIPQFGIVGAAAASTLSVIVLESLNVTVLYREFGIFPVKFREVLPVVLTGSLIAGILLFVSVPIPQEALYIAWGFLHLGAVAMVFSHQDVELASELIPS